MPNRCGRSYSESSDPTDAASGGDSFSDECACVCVASVFEEAYAVRDRILTCAKKAGFDESARFGIQLAFDEAIANAIVHGNERRADAVIRITYRISPEAIQLSIADEGTGFDPSSVPDPTEDENLEVPAGRGLFLMQAYMTHVEYNREGNVVTMVHRRSGDQKHAKKGTRDSEGCDRN